MRILGIDVGHSSIKAIEMDSAFGRFDIHDYHEYAIQPGEPPEQSVQKLVQQLAKTPDKIIVSVTQKQTTFRNLQLPTRDKKAIQTGIRFELEDELPFAPENCVFESSILSQSKTGSLVHVAVSLKTYIQNELNFWKKTGVEPDVITTRSWAYRAFFNRLLPPGLAEDKDEPVLLIQMGSFQTTFYLHWKGAPALMHEMDWGGQDLTRILAEKATVSETQAESLKLGQALLSPADAEAQMTPEQAELCRFLEAGMEPLLAELKRIQIAARNLTQRNIRMLYLAGGTSLIPGMARWIEQRTGVSTQLLPSLSSITTSGVTYSPESDARFILALSLSLCLVAGADRTASLINFRKGEFAKNARSQEVSLQALRRPLISAGIVMSCLFISLLIQSSVYKHRLVQTDALLERTVKSFFGQISNSAMRTYLTNTTTLRASVQKELNKQRELSRLFGPNAHSPLEFLKNLSTFVPKDTIVDLIHFENGTPPAESYSTKEKSTANLSFLLSNPQIAERLSSLLSTKLEGFQKGKMEEVAATTDEDLKKWKITFTGKPFEETYAK